MRRIVWVLCAVLVPAYSLGAEQKNILTNRTDTAAVRAAVITTLEPQAQATLEKARNEYQHQKHHFIYTELKPDRVIVRWDDLSTLPASWLTITPGKADRTIGYLVYLTPDFPVGWHEFRPHPDSIQVFYVNQPTIELTNLTGGITYNVVVTYVLRPGGQDQAVTNLGVKPGYTKYNQYEQFTPPKNFVGGPTSSFSPANIRVTLSQLYAHREDYLGKVIEIQGYVGSKGTPIESTFANSRWITKPFMGSDGLLTDGDFTIAVRGAGPDHMEQIRNGRPYASLIAYFYSISKPIKDMQENWPDKSQYVCQLLEHTSRSKGPDKRP